MSPVATPSPCRSLRRALRQRRSRDRFPPCRLGLFAKLAAGVTEADDIVAVVSRGGASAAGRTGLSEKQKWSSVTGVFSGAPRSFQSGSSSFRARGSITAPDRIWAPTSVLFDHADGKLPAFFNRCLRRMAEASPDGPAPTITASNSIDPVPFVAPRSCCVVFVSDLCIPRV